MSPLQIRATGRCGPFLGAGLQDCSLDSTGHQQSHSGDVSEHRDQRDSSSGEGSVDSSVGDDMIDSGITRRAHSYLLQFLLLPRSLQTNVQWMTQAPRSTVTAATETHVCYLTTLNLQRYRCHKHNKRYAIEITSTWHRSEIFCLPDLGRAGCWTHTFIPALLPELIGTFSAEDLPESRCESSRDPRKLCNFSFCVCWRAMSRIDDFGLI